MNIKAIRLFAALLLLLPLTQKAYADDYYNVTLDASNGFNVYEAIDLIGEWDFYSFTAPYEGTFSFYTTGDTDTVGLLYSITGNEIIAVDDDDHYLSGDVTVTDYNFCIQTYLYNGERLELTVAEFLNNATGYYTVYGYPGAWCGDGNTTNASLNSTLSNWTPPVTNTPSSSDDSGSGAFGPIEALLSLAMFGFAGIRRYISNK